ncbi:hypothetical protein EDD17DRAFT_633047 [Pisolithus thermaeus]|nr:hypothetical protein EDD17DRAFT_633047 [Pisolithus thermaeus]
MTRFVSRQSSLTPFMSPKSFFLPTYASQESYGMHRCLAQRKVAAHRCRGIVRFCGTSLGSTRYKHALEHCAPQGVVPGVALSTIELVQKHYTKPAGNVTILRPCVRFHLEYLFYFGVFYTSLWTVVQPDLSDVSDDVPAYYRGQANATRSF